MIPEEPYIFLIVLGAVFIFGALLRKAGAEELGRGYMVVSGIIICSIIFFCYIDDLIQGLWCANESIKDSPWSIFGYR